MQISFLFVYSLTVSHSHIIIVVIFSPLPLSHPPPSHTESLFPNTSPSYSVVHLCVCVSICMHLTELFL